MNKTKGKTKKTVNTSSPIEEIIEVEEVEEAEEIKPKLSPKEQLIEDIKNLKACRDQYEDVYKEPFPG